MKPDEKGGIPRDLRWVKRRDENEDIFAWPNGLREKAGIVISCRGPGPARKKKGTPVAERRWKKMHRCALVAMQ